MTIFVDTDMYGYDPIIEHYNNDENFIDYHCINVLNLVKNEFEYEEAMSR